MKSKTITLKFDDPKDCDEVLDALSKKTEITWNSETKKAMIATFKNDRVVLISKSIVNIPAPIRL